MRKFLLASSAAAICLSVSHASASTILNTDFDEIGSYFTIATDNHKDDAAIKSSNGEHGANRQQASDGSNVKFTGGGVAGPNTKSTPVDNNGWETDTRPTDDALDVFEGVTFTGDMALTSTKGKFNYNSTNDLYAQTGIDCAANSLNKCDDGNKEGFYYDPTDTPPNAIGGGGTGSALSTGVNLYDPVPLINELDAWQALVAGLDADLTYTFDGYTDQSKGKGNAPVLLNVDSLDTDGDGIAVIDINPSGGDTFSLNNTDWIIDSDVGTLALFRLRGDTLLDMSNASILAGVGYKSIFEDISGSTGSSPFGIAFVSWENYGEDVETFAADNLILNHVAFHELSAFANDNYRQNSNNRINLQNAQGCAQFVGPEVEFSNTRFNGCVTPTHQPTSVPVPASVGFLLTGLGLFAVLGRGGAIRRFRKSA